MFAAPREIVKIVPKSLTCSRSSRTCIFLVKFFAKHEKALAHLVVQCDGRSH